MSPLINSVIANIIVSLISLIGAVTIFQKKFSSKELTSILVSLAAGVMLGASFFDILPEAFEELEIPSVLLWTLVGIITSFLMERFLLWYHHHHEETHNIKPSAYLVLFGDTIHNLVDGVAITAAFLISIPTGITTAIAIAVHEIPQELADFSVLVNAGMSKKKALLYNFFTALSAVVGAVVSFLFLSSFVSIIPIALSITAGMFIYISLADLVPDLHHAKSSYLNIAQSLPFIIGIIIMLLLTRYVSHEHEEQFNDTDHVVEHIEEPNNN